MGANAGMEWSIDGREVDGLAILGNGMTWRRRVLFSQEAGDMVFALQTVLI
jgi:hypothetical protein